MWDGFTDKLADSFASGLLRKHLQKSDSTSLLENPTRILTRKSNSKIQLENPTRKSNSKIQLENPTRNPNSGVSLSQVYTLIK